MGNKTSYTVTKNPAADINEHPRVALTMDLDENIRWLSETNKETMELHAIDTRNACVQCLQQIRDKKMNIADEWDKYKHVSFTKGGVHVLCLTSDKYTRDDSYLVYTIRTV